MEALEGETEIPKDQLKPITPLDKIIVAFAGPLFSFMLACVFAILVWQLKQAAPLPSPGCLGFRKIGSTRVL